MNQEINLYQEPAEPADILLSFAHMLQISGLFIIALMLFSGYLFYSHYQTQAELVELKKRQRNLDRGLQTAKRKVPTEKDRENMEKRLVSLDSIRATKQKMVVTLSQLQYGDSEGFSGYFKALGKQIVSGVAFTGFKFSQGGSYILLNGHAYDPEFVPKLIDKLGQENVFKGTVFEVFKVNSDEETNVVRFTLESG